MTLILVNIYTATMDYVNCLFSTTLKRGEVLSDDKLNSRAAHRGSFYC